MPFQDKDLAFIFWSKWILWEITAFKVSSCELLKLMSKGAPSYFAMPLFKQTVCLCCFFLCKSSARTTGRGVRPHPRQQTGVVTCFSRQCSSASAHQLLIPTMQGVITVSQNADPYLRLKIGLDEWKTDSGYQRKTLHQCDLHYEQLPKSSQFWLGSIWQAIH